MHYNVLNYLPKPWPSTSKGPHPDGRRAGVGDFGLSIEVEVAAVTAAFILAAGLVSNRGV